MPNNAPMSRETLELLHQCLLVQQLPVADPGFRDTARRTVRALEELDAALADGADSQMEKVDRG